MIKETKNFRSNTLNLKTSLIGKDLPTWKSLPGAMAQYFTELQDTENSYTGKKGSILRVNEAETGIEFAGNDYVTYIFSLPHTTTSNEYFINAVRALNPNNFEIFVSLAWTKKQSGSSTYSQAIASAIYTSTNSLAYSTTGSNRTAGFTIGEGGVFLHFFAPGQQVVVGVVAFFDCFTG